MHVLYLTSLDKIINKDMSGLCDSLRNIFATLIIIRVRINKELYWEASYNYERQQNESERSNNLE